MLGSMSAGGVNDPSVTLRLAWGAAMAAFAAVLLLAGGRGIEAVQQASVLSTAPFGIIMLFMCWALYKSLRADAREEGVPEEGGPQEEPRTARRRRRRLARQRGASRPIILVAR